MINKLTLFFIMFLLPFSLILDTYLIPIFSSHKEEYNKGFDKCVEEIYLTTIPKNEQKIEYSTLSEKAKSEAILDKYFDSSNDFRMMYYFNYDYLPMFSGIPNLLSGENQICKENKSYLRDRSYGDVILFIVILISLFLFYWTEKKK